MKQSDMFFIISVLLSLYRGYKLDAYTSKTPKTFFEFWISQNIKTLIAKFYLIPLKNPNNNPKIKMLNILIAFIYLFFILWLISLNYFHI